ncbi:MAG: hypothetical protein KA096_01435 [Bacteroidales bacterium]|nr:hypothetical protein [Bacteroidales bacterium]
MEKFETKPIEGYQEHINEVTGDKFPYCCPNHRLFYERLKELCTEPNLAALPEKIIRQFAYTEYHIIQRIKREDWYKDITDYITYNYFSFGHPGYGVFAYLKSIIQFLEQTDAEIPAPKRKRIIEFIETYLYKEKCPDWGAQLEMLYSIYQRWQKLFPFELTSYFRNLGEYFNKNLPFFYIADGDFNPYLKTYKPQIHTKVSLMEYLMKLTNEILTKINGAMLQKKGLILNPDQIKFELAIKSREQKLKRGYIDILDADESRINIMIEEWFHDEKEFLNVITPFIIESVPGKKLIESPEQPLKLEQIFTDVSKYKYVMEILVKQKYIKANTYVWYDDHKGNKAFSACLIKHLHSQGYFKDNKRPSNEEIKMILKNSLGWEVGLDTIKRSKSTSFDFSFIPPASTIS